METRFMSNQNMAGDLGDSKKKGFFEKVKEHKKEIATGAVIVISAVLVVKNKGAFQSVIKSLRMEEALTSSLETQNNIGSLISESISTGVPSNLPKAVIIVNGHVRNLPAGWKPSIGKVELAEKCGYSLGEHQTFVTSYIKAAA